MELIPLLEQAKTSRGALSHAGLVFLLSLERREDLEALFAAAYDVKCRFIGRNVSLRGLIEMGNICSKDCYYCGIRRSNCKVSRFQLTPDDVVAMAMEAYHARYGSIAIQSGEIESDAHTAMITEILRKISAATNGGLGITLSLGEQTEDVYRQWFEAGAHRYLLRIEEANEARYRALHPAEGHDYHRRSACLDTLRRIGYQVGSGVMCGLPGQTADLFYKIFFRQADVTIACLLIHGKNGGGGHPFRGIRSNAHFFGNGVGLQKSDAVHFLRQTVGIGTDHIHRLTAVPAE